MVIAGPQAVFAKICYTLRSGLNTQYFVESVTINCERYIEGEQKVCYPKIYFLGY